MTTKEKFNLIERNTEEVIMPEELKGLLDAEEKLKHYIGFEISGKIHLGTGLMCMGKVKDFMEAGVECTIFLADWHTWINDKLGGDMETIQEIAVGYFKEGLKASLKALGGDPEKLNFVLGSELYHNNDAYWATVIEVSKNITLSRNLRSISIMGREEGEGVDFAKLIYPPMQVADIFAQGITLAHAGMDQRKAHVVMRDVADKLTICPARNSLGKKIKPLAVHHPLLLGLQKPPMWPVPKEKLRDVWASAKMSKSKPKSAVFITDSPDEIREKILDAFCPQNNAEFNPVLDWVKRLVFMSPSTIFEVDREERFGGKISFSSFAEVEDAFVSGDLHSQDLKRALAEFLVVLLEPVREHFDLSENKKLLERMNDLAITR
ncbi:tyrosine--tRNA ligase [candidate division WWE3 bacterium]|nr:tyrosine--tRNA ligase [candidate division WWE3 bacterium]